MYSRGLKNKPLQQKANEKTWPCFKMAASTYKRSEDKKTQMAQRCKSGIRTGLVVGSNQAADLCLYQEREGKRGEGVSTVNLLLWRRRLYCDLWRATKGVRMKIAQRPNKSPNQSPSLAALLNKLPEEGLTFKFWLVKFLIRQCKQKKTKDIFHWRLNHNGKLRMSDNLRWELVWPQNNCATWLSKCLFKNLTAGEYRKFLRQIKKRPSIVM